MLETRAKFVGSFERMGSKPNWHGYAAETILLRNVRDEAGKVVTAHLWFNYTGSFRSLGKLNAGDVIEFEARVTDYVKGYVNYRARIDRRKTDYKLSRPTKVRRVDPYNSPLTKGRNLSLPS